MVHPQITERALTFIERIIAPARPRKVRDEDKRRRRNPKSHEDRDGVELSDEARRAARELADQPDRSDKVELDETDPVPGPPTYRHLVIDSDNQRMARGR